MIVIINIETSKQYNTIAERNMNTTELIVGKKEDSKYD